MVLAACPACQARYKVPDTAAGKRTTCKKCGESFRIAAASAAPHTRPSSPRAPASALVDDLEALAQGSAIEMERPAAAVARPTDTEGTGDGFPPVSPGTAYSPSIAAVEEVPSFLAGYGGYLSALGRSPMSFRRPTAIFVFLGLWLLLAVREVLQSLTSIMPFGYGAGLAGMATFVISGLYMAYQLKLVEAAAGGERGLPSLTIDEGMWDDVLVPFFQMLSTKVAAALPVVLFLFILSMRMQNAVTTGAGAAPPGASPIPGSSTLIVLVLLALFGLFIWPMLVLVVACGSSVTAMFQLDLIVATVIKSFPAYLLTVITVCISFVLRIAISASVMERVNPKTDWGAEMSSVVLLPTIFVGINLFFDILSMRAIGYYYHYFKHRFAWSWE